MGLLRLDLDYAPGSAFARIGSFARGLALVKPLFDFTGAYS